MLKYGKVKRRRFGDLWFPGFPELKGRVSKKFTGNPQGREATVLRDGSGISWRIYIVFYAEISEEDNYT